MYSKGSRFLREEVKNTKETQSIAAANVCKVSQLIELFFRPSWRFSCSKHSPSSSSPKIEAAGAVVQLLPANVVQIRVPTDWALEGIVKAEETIGTF